MNSGKTIFVYCSPVDGEQPESMGVLSAQNVRNKEVFAFEFDSEWLRRHPEYRLDPDLQNYTGPQYSVKANFGLFMDSAPDRWGRKLMMRREAIRARKAAEKPQTLLESDYLLGVYDETRMGALRFKLSPDGGFQNDDTAMAAPPWARLRELEEASRHLEDDTLTSEHEKWLSMLLAPGSSLGGARPKACIVSPDGDLWIAKFPAKDDTVNTSAWEYATMLMARDADLDVPDVKKETFSAKGSTFLVKRFDRAGTRRIHFASAMTLLGKIDGLDADDGCSYLDIAEFIIQQSVRPQQDLRELWRRIVFSIAVSNTDDHLRNHGFLFGNGGWMLSPVYDVNPNPQGLGLSLNISLDDNSLDFDVAREVAPFFRLKPQEAEAILDKIVAIVSNWRNYARRSGLDDGEMEMMASAFRV